MARVSEVFGAAIVRDAASPLQGSFDRSRIVARQFTKKLAKTLKHSRHWLRQDAGSDEELKALASSFMDRAINPILVRQDGEIMDGNRRLAGILLAFGPEAEVPVCVTDEDITDAVAVEIMLESSEHTKSLTLYEKAVGNQRWLELNPGKSAKDLAHRRNCNPATISRSLALFKCVEAVISAARDGRITESDWVAMSQAAPDDQLLMLTKRLNGTITSRDGLSRHARLSRAGETKSATVAAKSIMFVLANGTIVQFKADGITLDRALSAIVDVKKEIDTARSKGHDAKSLAPLMKKRLKEFARAREAANATQASTPEENV
jgi:ParB/RepB/Spo0J family partition protein